MAGQRYRVTGEQPVAGRKPGEEVDASGLAAYGVKTDEQVAALIEGGAIKPIKGGSASEKKE